MQNSYRDGRQQQKISRDDSIQNNKQMAKTEKFSNNILYDITLISVVWRSTSLYSLSFIDQFNIFIDIGQDPNNPCRWSPIFNIQK